MSLDALDCDFISTICMFLIGIELVALSMMLSDFIGVSFLLLAMGLSTIASTLYSMPTTIPRNK